LWCSAWPFQPNNASINARIILQSTHSSLLFTLQLSVCLHRCNIPRHDNLLSLDNNTSLLDPRSLSHRHVLCSFLSSSRQACVVAHTTIRHPGGSAPASDCDERRPPDHHPPTTAGRASCQQDLCRHLDSTTTVNCLYLPTKPPRASFLISHHPYTLFCERGWLAASPRP
jgi:hypothetical protein